MREGTSVESSSENEKPANVVDVGDASIKSRRALIDVKCGPGGKVCDYVPFYYAPRSPMLYSIICGNVPDVDPDQRRLVDVLSSTEAAYEAGLACVFTDGNAATAFTEFHDDPAKLDHVVDWPLMRARYWFNTPDDPDRRRRRMAEFLVHRSLPLGSVAPPPASCSSSTRSPSTSDTSRAAAEQPAASEQAAHDARPSRRHPTSQMAACGSRSLRWRRAGRRWPSGLRKRSSLRNRGQALTAAV
jgi:hypothetical protein